MIKPTEQATVASNSFAIPRVGEAFRTAAFGGEALDNNLSNDPTLTNDMTPGMGGGL